MLAIPNSSLNLEPCEQPTEPTESPTDFPTDQPSKQPSSAPTGDTNEPSRFPTEQPSSGPTTNTNQQQLTRISSPLANPRHCTSACPLHTELLLFAGACGEKVLCGWVLFVRSVCFRSFWVLLVRSFAGLWCSRRGVVDHLSQSMLDCSAFC